MSSISPGGGAKELTEPHMGRNRNATLGGKLSVCGLIGCRREKFPVLQLRAVHIFVGDLQ
jgi:hypothetical protein